MSEALDWAAGRLEGGAPTRGPLEGKRICLVFGYSLSHYSRLLLEIGALQRAGAKVRLLTQHPIADSPPGVWRDYAPLGAPSRRVQSIGESGFPRRPLRGADHALRRVTRAVVGRWTSGTNYVRYRRVLKRIANEVDAFWVIDFPRLEAVMEAAKDSPTRVVYETVDLVPEYNYRGAYHRQKCIDDERRLIGGVDGFITACESYADYYMEMYGDTLRRRPVVRDNVPREIVTHIVPTASPLRLLFLGSLMFDRPVLELIEAVAATTTDVSLTFQGKNYLSEAPARWIGELGLPGRVEVLDPCSPDSVVETASAYDVGIVALRGADENERRASTAKLFAYMAAGLAVLGSDLPGIARIVHTHDNGLLVDGMDPHAWAIAIDRFGLMPPTSIDSMKQRSLRAANLYAWEKQEPAFIGEFVRVLSRQPNGGSQAK
jgi:glycosyltransferase involved in cell wall biosynthesis